MAFLEQRLDAKITHGATGGPTVTGRTKAYLPNGKLHQNFLATQAVHRYDVSHGVRSRDDFQIVLDLWYVVMFTPYEGFRFKDWRDFLLTQVNSKLSSIGGSSTLFQIQRRHSFGGIEHVRPITKPVASTVTVYRTRSGSVTTAPATVDYTTGVATIAGHLAGDTYTCSGEFDVPVTFTDDEWTSSLEVSTQNLHVMSSSIKLEELKQLP